MTISVGIHKTSNQTSKENSPLHAEIAALRKAFVAVDATTCKTRGYACNWLLSCVAPLRARELGAVIS